MTLKLGDIEKVFKELKEIGDKKFKLREDGMNKPEIDRLKDKIRKEFLLKIARYNAKRILSKRVKKRKYSFENHFKEFRKKLDAERAWI